MMKRNRTLIMTVLSLALILTATVGVSFAYFTDYESARGGAVLHLSGQTELTENVKDDNKEIGIRNTGETDMLVRVFVIGDEKILTVSGDGWTQGADGAWYYTSILKVGEEAPILKAEVSAKESDNIDFDVIVAHESSRVVYDVRDGKNIVKTPEGWDESIVSAIPAA